MTKKHQLPVIEVYDFNDRDEVLVDKHEIYDKIKSTSFDKDRRYEGIKEKKRQINLPFSKKL